MRKASSCKLNIDNFITENESILYASQCIIYKTHRNGRYYDVNECFPVAVLLT